MASTSLTPRTFNREELAWAAGFFDGEGHTRGWKRNATATFNAHTRVGLTISQADSPELLERFQRAVGGVGVVYGPYEYRNRRPTQKAFYVFSTATFEHAQHCVCCIWPWLGSIKRAQALKSLRYWHEQPRRWFRASNGSNRLVCIRGHRVEGDNSRTTKTGYTICLECRRLWQRNAKQKKCP